MALNLAAEYKGFLKFFNHAGNDLLRWFGPQCNNDPVRIAFLAAREWDGMGDLERKPFIKSSNAGQSQGVNSYLRYLLHSRYSDETPFDPSSGKEFGHNWKSMTAEEKLKFSSLNFTESGRDYVIGKREKLHQLYEPKNLCILEFILRTKPRWPSSSRLWYFRHESQSIGSSEARQKWLNLSDKERAIYESCAVLDKKRYNLEKNAWITKILEIDIEADQFTLSDFTIPEVKSRVDSLGSFVEMSRDLPALISLKRPRNPFSLFIEAYRYQIRDERPEFQFGRHLRECSEAWSQLSENEREFYHEESRKLKRQRRDLLSRQPEASSDRLTIPLDLFNPNKAVFGACRPSHLYPKIPSPMRLWWDEMRLSNDQKLKDYKAQWVNLSDEERRPFIEKHQRMKEEGEQEKLRIDNKHKQVKRLLKEASKLEDLKQKLRLIGCGSKTVKNLYD